MSTSNLLPKASLKDHLELKQLINRYLKQGGGDFTLFTMLRTLLILLLDYLISVPLCPNKRALSLKKKSSLKLYARSHMFIGPKSRLGVLPRETHWTLIYLWHNRCFVLVYRTLMYSQNFSICCTQMEQN